MQAWKIIDTFLQIKTPWVDFIGERCQDEKNNILEYYRVEKSSSLIVLVFQDGHLLLPNRYYRHGIQKETLDFAGGRINPALSLKHNALEIIYRELKVKAEDVDTISIHNAKSGWIINSSFSNQHLYVAYLHIKRKVFKENALMPLTNANIMKLIKKIDCLQCKSALMAWALDHLTKETNE